ncbi:glycosyltransferase family 1 protein [Sphingomonas koreensis]|uniref:Glycosyltransferase family 1 protein n=2 Tax=Sphingomonas koreensis TaxID=93064 RepID=A0A430G1W8_9SPHN|nr:glycosyltransferase family 1 protein [Sphingomonas koreensis]
MGSAAEMILGINASRARSGGARAHLINLLEAATPEAFGFTRIHVWAPADLCALLPRRDWLFTHSPPTLQRALPAQLWWELRTLPRLLAEVKADILFNVDAGSVAEYHPAVTMSQDMLSYEPGEVDRYPIWRPLKLRILALRYVQNRSLRMAQGAIFLTHYAGDVIQAYCGKLSNVTYIAHGLSDAFRYDAPKDALLHRPIRCVYVSPVWAFKHQWHVVEAIAQLRAAGRDVTLTLVGGGDEADIARLERQIAQSDPDGRFVERIGHVDPAQLPGLIRDSDLYLFASSCENLPITLLEGMGCGIPIACSDRGPMPEVLQDGGVYFDPTDPASIAAAVARLIEDPAIRSQSVARAMALAAGYSWDRCAHETLDFLAKVARNHGSNG